jgi:hypothetical protein
MSRLNVSGSRVLLALPRYKFAPTSRCGEITGTTWHNMASTIWIFYLLRFTLEQ